MFHSPSRRPWPALLLWLALFALYNSDGREIGGIDSQPSKFAARALVLDGTLAVDRDVRRAPPLADRPSFARDRQGHYRSAYSPTPALTGAVTAGLLRAVGVDLDAPRAANLIAVLTASATTATAVVLVFLTLRRFAPPAAALWVSIGLGAGTNLWIVASRTLGQHDLVALGFALTLYGWTRTDPDLAARHRWLGAAGLALAATARLQTLPAVAVLGAGLLVRAGWRRAAGPLAGTAVAVGALFAVQWHWFGSPLGAVPRLESLHPVLHGVTGSLSAAPWVGAAGLLVSPNRGLLIFSPVVLIALAGVPASLRRLRDCGAAWIAGAALVQYAVYSAYSVWWGGHTFGPRYLVDMLVLLAPSAAMALAVFSRRFVRGLFAAALVWSIVVAGTGAFFADRWNTDPADVDTHHERLWEWTDLQIVRAWRAGPSDQNFNLFNWTSVRQQE